MNNKFYLVNLNRCLRLKYSILVKKCLDSNPLISMIAIQALLIRNDDDEMVPEEILRRIVDKLTIEDVYSLVVNNNNSRLTKIACIRLKEILAYYDNNFELYQKINDDEAYFKAKSHN